MRSYLAGAGRPGRSGEEPALERLGQSLDVSSSVFPLYRCRELSMRPRAVSRTNSSIIVNDKGETSGAIVLLKRHIKLMLVFGGELQTGALS